MFKQPELKRAKTSPSESLIAIQAKITALEKQLTHEPDEFSRYRIKAQLASLLIKYGEALSERGEYLKTFQAYFRVVELTGHNTAIGRLFGSKQTANPYNVAHEPNNLTELSSLSASECFWHGLQALSGIGLSNPNKQVALNYIKTAANKGHAGAQVILGMMYAQGHGVEQDDEQAVSWYRKAAEQGHTIAQYNLGWMYRQGRGVEQDDEQAVSWYRKAAEQGHTIAQYSLGWMYRQGRGVELDDKQALSWYRKAAEQGHAGAQYNLGDMYAYDLRRGAEQDDKQAQLWFERHINNLGIDKIPVHHVKSITYFFNGVLEKTRQKPKPYIDCLLRAKRLGLDINSENSEYAHQVFIIYQILKHLNYTRLIGCLQEIDESIKDNFTPENYLHKLAQLYSTVNMESCV